MRTYIAFSNTFASTFKIDIGRLFSTSVLSPFLWSGIIFATFSSSGKMPVFSDRFTMNVRGFLIISAAILIILGSISSTPVALNLFSLIYLNISFSVTWNRRKKKSVGGLRYLLKSSIPGVVCFCFNFWILT